MNMEERIASWETFADVDEWAKEAASLYATVPGIDITHLGSYLNKSVATLKAVFENDIIKAYIERLRVDIMLKRKDPEEKLTRIREMSYEKMLEAVESGEISVKDLVAVAKFASDYHPDRYFTKMERKEETVTHTHRVSGHVLESLKQRHLQATEVKKIEGEAIDISAQDVQDLTV